MMTLPKPMSLLVLSSLVVFLQHHGVNAFVVTTKCGALVPKTTTTRHYKNAFTLPRRIDITSTQLAASEQDDGQPSKLPMLLDPGTKGGALFLSLLLFVTPILLYIGVTQIGGVDPIEAGKWIGVGFTVITTLLWVSTYIFRVATKDMTYAKQLKDYENAVIAKRLEELDEDEVQALVEDIERDDF